MSKAKFLRWFVASLDLSGGLAFATLIGMLTNLALKRGIGDEWGASLLTIVISIQYCLYWLIRGKLIITLRE